MRAERSRTCHGLITNSALIGSARYRAEFNHPHSRIGAENLPPRFARVDIV